MVSRGLCFRRFLAGCNQPSATFSGSVSDLGQGKCWLFLELRTKQSALAICAFEAQERPPPIVRHMFS